MSKYGNIYIKNVYYMLSYAFSVLKQEEYADLATEEFEDAQNLFAAILAKGIGRQLKQGLYREYVNRAEDLSVVRGKVDIEGTVRNRLQRKLMVACEYDELTVDNTLNRILKTTALLLIANGDVDSRYRDELRKEMLLFAEVEKIDPSSIRWSTLRFSRGNQTYQMLISICQLVLEGMLLTTEAGEKRLAKFIDEQRMSRLFERFILEYYKQECSLVKADAPQIGWVLDDGVDTMLPKMQSDIVLTRGDRILIIDAKYYSHTTQKHFDKHTVHSNNLYQIFTYVKNKEAELAGEPHNVSGMLLYARTRERIQPDSVYQMSGNQISVKTLDLNQPFEGVRKQLDGIVEEHFGL